MDILAIIPARGGSVGLPRKNALSLAGKPLIAHTISAALCSALVTRVVVSTDDPEIGNISRQHGAEVIWRPVEISGDKSSSEEALLHTLGHLRADEGYEPEIVVFLQCTSPLTEAEDIDGVINALLGGSADCALTVAPFHHFLWGKKDDGSADGINHDKDVRLLRQDREPQFLETGAVYVMRTAGFLQAAHRFFGKCVIYETPPERTLEVDEPVDFLVAETLKSAQERQDLSALIPERVEALVMDFDGVFTDNRVYVLEDGREAVACSRGDGLGLSEMRRRGDICMLVLSAEENPVVKARCEKLGIECVHNAQDKLADLSKWMRTADVNPDRVVYVGNDINDIECMKNVGCSVAVQDAHPSVKNVARIVLNNCGGNGALRELSELILLKMEEH